MSQIPEDGSENVINDSEDAMSGNENVMVLDEESETLSMNVPQDTVKVDPEGSALNRAPDESYKPDEAGWTIPGLDEQYQKKESAPAEEKPEAAADVPADNIDPKAMIGQTILGQYKLEKLLGEGGMGTVYLAQQVTMDRQAAVKFLLPELGNNTEMVQRFYREAKAASNLKHPGIVQTYNFGCTSNNMMYLAMEFVDGLTLQKYLRIHGKLGWREVCELGSKMADALAVAHSAKVVHRDLKPENIILQPVNDRLLPKILDFGIAKVVSNDGKEPTLTRLGTVFGTPSYMSPEQAQGIPIDYHTDIYSLGVMFYVMLSGNLPIMANSPAAQLMAVNLQPPTPFSDEVAAAMPPELRNLVFKMLEKDPAKRPDSMIAVRNSMEKILYTYSEDTAIYQREPKHAAGIGKLTLCLAMAAAGAIGWVGSSCYYGHISLPGFSGSQQDKTAPSLDKTGDGGSDILPLAHIEKIEPGEPKLLETSSPEKPVWIDDPPFERISPKEFHFTRTLRSYSNLGEAAALLRALLTDDVVSYYLAAAVNQPFKKVVALPALDARTKAMKALEQAEGEEAKAAAEELITARAQAVSAMIEARFPELYDDFATYWAKYAEYKDGRRSEYYDLKVHGILNPRNFKGEYYFDKKAYKALGLTVTHFMPSLVWLHGTVNGAVVLAVAPKSPAGQAGLKAGDVIISLDDKPTEGLLEAAKYLAKWEKKRPAKRVKVLISRDGQEQEIYLFDRKPPKPANNGKKPKKS